MEQIYKQIPKQRRPQEHYEQPFPVPEIDVDKELGTVALEHIDETLEATE